MIQTVRCGYLYCWRWCTGWETLTGSWRGSCKKQNPDVKVVALEPADVAGFFLKVKAGAHKIPGIGAGIRSGCTEYRESMMR